MESTGNSKEDDQQALVSAETNPSAHLAFLSIGIIAKLKAVVASTATTMAESCIETAERLERYLEDHKCQDAATLVPPNSFITSLKERAALFREEGAKDATEQKECDERQG